MSQYYPQYSPSPPPRGPEGGYDEYEYDDEGYYDDEESSGDTIPQRLLIFISGGCLVFICMSCCVLMFMGLWLLDPGSSFVSAPIEGSDLGLTFEEPAFSDESVVNDDGVKLTILEVNHNVALPGIPPVDGRELVVITIELVNLGTEDASYNESDFLLINQDEEAYTISPLAASVEGALSRGKLAPEEGAQGRLVFDLVAGEFTMILGWEGGRDATPRFIFME